MQLFNNIHLREHIFHGVLAPHNPRWFKSISQTETNITLQWEKVDSNLTYRLVFNQRQINVSDSASQEQVTHTVDGLTEGTKYNFSVFAVFENIQSSRTEHTAATGELWLFSLCWFIRKWDVGTLNNYI